MSMFGMEFTDLLSSTFDSTQALASSVDRLDFPLLFVKDELMRMKDRMYAEDHRNEGYGRLCPLPTMHDSIPLSTCPDPLFNRTQLC